MLNGEWRSQGGGLFLNHVVSAQTAFNESWIDAPVKGCQRGTLLNRKRQKVVIGEVFISEEDHFQQPSASSI
jgi:hypothetical protein